MRHLLKTWWHACADLWQSFVVEQVSHVPNIPKVIRCASASIALAVGVVIFGTPVAQAVDPLSSLDFSDLRVIFDEENISSTATQLAHVTGDQDASTLTWSTAKPLLSAAIPGFTILTVYHVVHRVNPQRKEELAAVQARVEASDGRTDIRVLVFRREGDGGSWTYLFNTYAWTGSVASDKGIIAETKAFIRAFDLAYEERSGRAILVTATSYLGSSVANHELRYWIIDGTFIHSIADYTSPYSSTAPRPGLQVGPGQTQQHNGWGVYSSGTFSTIHQVQWVLLSPRPRSDEMTLVWSCDAPNEELFGVFWNGSTAIPPSWGSHAKLGNALQGEGGALLHTRPFAAAFGASGKGLLVYSIHVTDQDNSYLKYCTMDRTFNETAWQSCDGMSRRLYEVVGASLSNAAPPNFLALAAEPGGDRFVLGTHTWVGSGNTAPNRVYAAIWDCSVGGTISTNCWLNFAEGGETSSVTPRTPGVLDAALIGSQTSGKILEEQQFGTSPVAVTWVGEGASTRALLVYSAEHEDVAATPGTIDWAIWRGPVPGTTAAGAQKWDIYHGNIIQGDEAEEVSFALKTHPTSRNRAALAYSIKNSANDQKIAAMFFDKGAYDSLKTNGASVATLAKDSWVHRQTALGAINSMARSAGEDDFRGTPFGFDINVGFPKFFSGSGAVAQDQVLGVGSTGVVVKPIHVVDLAGLVRANRDLYIRIPDDVAGEWDVQPCGSLLQSVSITGSASAAEVSNQVCAKPDPGGANLRVLRVDVTDDFEVGDDLILGDGPAPLKLKNRLALSPAAAKFELEIDAQLTDPPDIDSDLVTFGVDVVDEATIRIAESLAIGAHSSGPAPNAFTPWQKLSTLGGDALGAELLKFRLTAVGEEVDLEALTLRLTLTGISAGQVTDVKLNGVAQNVQVDVVTGEVTIPVSYGPKLRIPTTGMDFVLTADVASLAATDSLAISVNPASGTNDVNVDGRYGSPPVDNLSTWGLVSGSASKTHRVAGYSPVTVSPNPALIGAPLTISWSNWASSHTSNPTSYGYFTSVPPPPPAAGTSFTGLGAQGAETVCNSSASASCVSRNPTAAVTQTGYIRLSGTSNSGTDFVYGDTAIPFKVAGKLSILNPTTQAPNALTQMPGPTPTKDLFKFLIGSSGENVTLDGLALSFTSAGSGIALADLSGLELWEGPPAAAPTTLLASGGQIVKSGSTIMVNKTLTVLPGFGLKEYTLRGIVSNLAANDSMTIGDTITVTNPTGVTSGVVLSTLSGAVDETVTGKTHTVSTYTITLSGLNGSQAMAIGQPLGISWAKANTSDPTAIQYTTTNGASWPSVPGCNLAQSPCSWTTDAVSRPGEANIRLIGTELIDNQSLTVPALAFPAFTIAGTLKAEAPSSAVTNAFTSTPAVTADLLRFKLTVTGESVTVNSLTIPLSGLRGITPTLDLSAVQLLDGVAAIGGTPTVTATSMQFTTPFTLSAGAHDLTVKATVGNLFLNDSLSLSFDATTNLGTVTGMTSGVALSTVGGISGGVPPVVHTVKGYTVSILDPGTLNPISGPFKIGDTLRVSWVKVPASGAEAPGDAVNVDFLVGATPTSVCATSSASCDFVLPNAGNNGATAPAASKFQVKDAAVSTSLGISNLFTVTGTLTLGPHTSPTVNAFSTQPVVNVDLFKFQLAASGEQVDLAELTLTWSGTGVVQSELKNLTLWRGGTQVGGAPTISANTITFNTIAVPKGAQNFVLRGDVENVSASGDSLVVGLATANLTTPVGQVSLVDLTTVAGAVSGSVATFTHTSKGYAVSLTPAQPIYKIGDQVQVSWTKNPASGPTAPGDAVNVDYFISSTDSGDCGTRPTSATSCTATLPATVTAPSVAKFRVEDAAVSTSMGNSSLFTVAGTAALEDHPSGQPGNAFVVLPTASNADLYRFRLTAAGEAVAMTTIVFDTTMAGIGASDVSGLTLIKDGVPVSAAFAVNPTSIAASLTGVSVAGGANFVLRGTVDSLVAGDELNITLTGAGLQLTGATSGAILGSVPGAISGTVSAMQHIAKSYAIDAPALNEVLGVGQTGYTVRWTPKGGSGSTVKVYFAKDGVTFGAPLATVSGTSWTWTPSVPDAISSVARIKIEDTTNPTIFGISQPFTIAGRLFLDAPSLNQVLKAGQTHTIRWHALGTYGNLRVEWTGEAGAPPYSAWTVLGTAPASSGQFSWATIDADATPPSGNTKVRLVDVEGDAGGTHPPAEAVSDVFKLARLKIVAPVTTATGETFWQIGSPQMIRWDSMGLNTVKLLYATTPDFATPIPLNGDNPVTASDNQLPWTIPDTPAPQARIRIYDPASGILSDSDPFHIAAKFTLVQPSAGLTGQVGMPVPIAWTTDAGTVPQALIQVSNDDFATIRSDSPGVVANVSPLTPAWVPASAGAAIKVRVCDARDPAVCAVSPAIRVTGLALESPEAGNRLVVGVPWTIRWNYDGAFSTVKIELLDETKTLIRTITPSTSVGAAGLGSYVWAGPLASDVGQIRYLRVADTAGSISADSAAFVIGEPFAFASPLINVMWGVGEQRQILWAPSMAQDPAVTMVKLEYWDGTQYVPLGGGAGTFPNTGGVLWTVPDLPDLLGDPQMVPSRPFTLRISDATPGHVVDAALVSPQVAASYYRVDWEVRSATPPNPLLSALSVSDTSGWFIEDFSLNGQLSRYYPAGTFSTIFSVKDVGGVISQGAKENWKPDVNEAGNPVVGCVSDPSIIGCHLRLVTIELLSAEAVVWKVYSQYEYQTGADAVDPADDDVEINTWLERTGKLVDNSDTLIEYGKIEIFENGALIRTLPAVTAPPFLPDAAGRFQFIWDLKREDGSLVPDGATYFTKATIRRNSRDFTSGGALNVTIPKKILTSGGGGGGGGVTLTELQNELKPVKDVVGDAAGVLAGTQVNLVSAVNDIRAATVGPGSDLGQVKNATVGADSTLGQIAAETVGPTSKLSEIHSATVGPSSTLEGVKAYLESPDAGLPKILSNQQAMSDQLKLKAQRRGGILNRDMELELGETATIQYRAEGGLPTLSVYDAAGAPVAAPALLLNATTGLYESALSLASLGEYRVVVSEPASDESAGTLDSVTVTVRAPLATADAISDLSTTLGDIDTNLNDLDNRVARYEQVMRDLQPLANATKDRAQQLVDDLAALSKDWSTLSSDSLTERLRVLAEAVGTPPAGESVYTSFGQLDAAFQTLKASGDVTMDSLDERLGTLEDLINNLPSVEAVDQTAQLTAINANLDALAEDVTALGTPAQGGAVQDVLTQIGSVQQAVGALQTAAPQPTVSDTSSLLSQLDAIKKSVESAQGSAAAVGLSQSAFNAAKEALTILQHLQTEIRTTGQAPINGAVLLGEAGDRLKSLSSSVTVIPTELTDKELAEQLRELAKKANGVATEKGYQFDELYELSAAEAGDVKTVRNQVEELKALLEVQRQILERNVNQPVVKTWFEAR